LRKQFVERESTARIIGTTGKSFGMGKPVGFRREKTAVLSTQVGGRKGRPGKD